MSSDMYNEIRELYITAAQRSPVNDIDSNVQVSNFNATEVRILFLYCVKPFCKRDWYDA